MCPLLEGIRLAFLHSVNFYEVLADGYHSPLTKTQIAELFYAGRLGRHHPCKPVTTKEWRTIDELFPLLKYQSCGPAMYESEARSTPSAKSRILILLFFAAACAVVMLWLHFASNAAQSDSPINMARADWPRTIQSAPPPAPQAVAEQPRDYQVAVAPPVTVEAARETVPPQQTQLARERTIAEQRQREQIQAENNRRAAEAAERERKAAGKDIIFPLDQDLVVQNVGGSAVDLRIHEIDVTSFDVRVNGAWRRNVPKHKGISGSGTDETPIYGNGRANLYYVWEISGRLNNCLLRVRDE